MFPGDFSQLMRSWTAAHLTFSRRWSAASTRAHREPHEAPRTPNTHRWWAPLRRFTSAHLFGSGEHKHKFKKTWRRVSTWFSDCLCFQSHSDGESQRSNMEREDIRSPPSTPSTPSVCSPTSTASSVPSTGKNVCASCGLEILDRYLLKVSRRPHFSISVPNSLKNIYIYFLRSGLKIDWKQPVCVVQTEAKGSCLLWSYWEWIRSAVCLFWCVGVKRKSQHLNAPFVFDDDTFKTPKCGTTII